MNHRWLSGLLASLLLIVAMAWAEESARPLHCIDAKTPKGLQDLFRHTGEPLPLVSAHRGGSGAKLPENCIATFEETLRHTYAIMEVDPRYTRDKVLVLNHDPRLDRTTTGKGLVADFTLQEIKQLRLKDRDGNPTDFQVTTLDEAMEWARGKAILVLDQKDVPVAERVRKIQEHKAEACTIVIVYSFKEAAACHALSKDIMMEVMIPSPAKMAEFEKTGVPWRNVVAFVGHEPPADGELCRLLHEKGVTCLVGSSRNVDRLLLTGKVKDIRECEKGYRDHLGLGADVIETDLPRDVGRLLYDKATLPKGREQYFRTESR